MAGNPNIAKYGENTRITSKNAKELQEASVESRKNNKTLEEYLFSEDSEGRIAEVAAYLLKEGDDNIRFKMLELYSKLRDKKTARENGELENKVIVYKGMDIEEVK